MPTRGRRLGGGLQQLGAQQDPAHNQSQTQRSPAQGGGPVLGCGGQTLEIRGLFDLDKLTQRGKIDGHRGVVLLLDQQQGLIFPAIGFELTGFRPQVNHRLAVGRDARHLGFLGVGERSGGDGDLEVGGHSHR